MPASMMNLYIFEDKSQEDMSKSIITSVAEVISKDKRWAWQEDALNMRDLCFGSHCEKSNLWDFAVFDYKSNRCCGYGALSKLNSSKKPFLEYLFVQLSDLTTIQAWTVNSSRDTTYISINGEIYGYIESYWKKFLLNCFSWRERWGIFWKQMRIGTVETGDYLFRNKKKYFCKGLVRADTLKVKKEGGELLPIRLAPDEGAMSDFALIPIKVPLALLGQRFDIPDYVIPKTKELVAGEDVLFMFVINIIFRELFFNQTYITIGD